MNKRIKRVASLLAVGLFSVILTACGGGSGGNSGSGTSSGSGTGRVSVLLTDGPTDQFDQIKVTVTSVQLLGEAAPVTISDRTETVDLLHLAGVSDLFSITDGVPAGSYDKIRLHVSRVELIKHDQSGNITQDVDAKLPANGKIDLNPRRSFRVSAGSTLVVQLDVDAGKSIHVVETGSGKYIFRPVVFVTILGGTDLPSRLVRIHGTVKNLDTTANAFSLCPTQVVSGDDSRQRDFSDSAHCIHVQLKTDTGVFSSSGDPASAGDVAEGSELTAIGFIQRLDDSESRAVNDDVDLQAAVVEMGPRGSFARLSGTTQSAVDTNDDQFDFALDTGQGYGADTTLPVQLQTGTHIFSRSAQALTAADIQPGMTARVDGVVALSNDQPDMIKSALVVLETTNILKQSGPIQSIDSATRNLTVTVSGQGDSCVHVLSDARILLVDNGTSEAINFGDLSAGQTVDAYGETTVNGCFQAETVIAYPASGG